MLLFNIRNYDDFQFLFGLETHASGAKSRKNKILLEHLKNPALIRYCRERNDMALLRIRSMAELKKLALAGIRNSGEEDPTLCHRVRLIGQDFWSGQYYTDKLDGLCEDFDKKAVRYVNAKTGRVYKMKAGKLFTSIVKETKLGQILSPQVINWLSEEFSRDWETFTTGQTPEMELRVDDNFRLIYDEEACKGFNGCSCMTGRGRHFFYENAVEAKAACLLDKDGFVLARGVIFTNATDQYGKKWRLLERQYSKGSSEVLKRLLIDLCKKGGHIDGYKQVGAGCSESRAFVANDGTSLMDLEFSIKCKLETWETLSYQDSFKFYSHADKIAYNYSDSQYDYRLDSTDYNLDGDADEDEEDYDDYHGYRCAETTLCYCHGREVYVDVDNLDDFVWVQRENEYYHKDDVAQCDNCGKWVVKENARHNPEAEAFFCDDDCERNYIKEHYHYSEYDDDYFPNEEDLTAIQMWDEETQNYKPMTISLLSREWLIKNGRAFGGGSLWFITEETLKQTA